MLFRRKIARSCSYCTFGTKTGDGGILCSKRGFRDEGSSCWRFRYDPCKRIPMKEKPLDFSRFRDQDFSLSDPALPEK